jgi:hypothetical protein
VAVTGRNGDDAGGIIFRSYLAELLQLTDKEPVIGVILQVDKSSPESFIAMDMRD